MLESLFNKVAGQVFSCDYCKIFKNIYLEKHLRMAASMMGKEPLHIQHDEEELVDLHDERGNQ